MRATPHTTTMRVSLALMLLIAWAPSILLTGCGGNANSQGSEPEPEASVPAVPVEAALASRGQISAFFSGTATLEAEQEAFVVAKAGGIVEEIFVEEGSAVEAGTPLAKLDDERLALDMERARVTLERMQRESERQKEMFDKQLVSAEEYESVRSEYEAQKAVYDLAVLQVEHTTVRAPITGVVSERFIKVGNMVQSNEQTFRVTDFRPLLAILYVPERELNRLRVGQRAEVRVDALSGDVFPGAVDRVSPVVDPSTGTFKVTVEVDDPTRRLKPGMFGRVSIVSDTRADVILVPRTAVLTEDDEESVFTVEDSVAVRRLVRTGYSDASMIEIAEGVDEGSVVITIGQNNLRDSSRVVVINQ